MSNQISLDKYISGAFLSNGLRIIVIFITMPFLKQMDEIFFIFAIWIITIFSTAISSYYIASNVNNRLLLYGSVEGIFSYILFIVFTFLGIQAYVDEMWIFLGFLLGGLLGGRYAENKKNSNLFTS